MFQVTVLNYSKSMPYEFLFLLNVKGVQWDIKFDYFKK